MTRNIKSRIEVLEKMLRPEEIIKPAIIMQLPAIGDSNRDQVETEIAKLEVAGELIIIYEVVDARR